ncbi:MAG: type 4a pilus biogenesis protein PilO [Gemmatimonadetes bacterium]|nr:type 4a pilus biogenesis protein PilO [Gemmatimonadota bacterium]
MALLPQEPRQQGALVAIVVALAGFYLFYDAMLTPANTEIADMATRLEVLESQNRTAQITATRGGADLEERTELYERHVRRLEQLIPAHEEVPQLLSDIAALARRMNVNWADVIPEADDLGTFYDKKSYSVRVEGEYHDVGRFVTAVASLPRIITPVNMDLQGLLETHSARDYQSPVQASFQIQTYVVPPPGSRTVPADTLPGSDS